MTSEKKGSQVKTKTVSVTTSANGNATLTDHFDEIIILAATVNRTDSICVPYRYTNDGTRPRWGVHVMDCFAALNALQGTFDLTLYYIDR